MGGELGALSIPIFAWRNLAHRTHADLEATGMKLRLDTWALSIDVSGQRLAVRNPDGNNDFIDYDEVRYRTRSFSGSGRGSCT